MKFFKKLVGENIYLSPRTADEEVIEKFTEWLNDFEVTDYTGRSAQVLTLEAERKWFETPKDDSQVFFIVRMEDNELIGSMGLHRIDNISRTATLGIFIGDKSGRNKGYGTEAIRLILDYGFNYLNLNNIKLDVMEFNDRAIACYKKCGFKEYGRRRKCYFLNGKYYDKIEMDILAEEFKEEKEEYIRNKNIK